MISLDDKQGLAFYHTGIIAMRNRIIIDLNYLIFLSKEHYNGSWNISLNVRPWIYILCNPIYP